MRLISTLSTYQPVGKLAHSRGGPEEPEAAPEWLRMQPGYAVGIAMEVPLSGIQFLSLRGGMKYAFHSELTTGSYVGTEPCGDRCTKARYESKSVSDASLFAVNTDLVLKPAPSRWRARPYALAGLGWKSRRLDYTSVPTGSVVDEAREEARGITSHLGIGVEIPVRSMVLSLETDIFGDLATGDDPPVHGGSHADAFFSIGLRLGL